jgi:hypothetical protein
LAENCSCIFGIRHIHVACQAKESIAVAGPRTGVKSGFAIAKHYLSNHQFRVGTKTVPTRLITLCRKNIR